MFLSDGQMPIGGYKETFDATFVSVERLLALAEAGSTGDAPVCPLSAARSHRCRFMIIPDGRRTTCDGRREEGSGGHSGNGARNASRVRRVVCREVWSAFEGPFALLVVGRALRAGMGVGKR
ncbi:hypothetical protein ACQEVM_17855 [Streptomyces sp. CA-243310]|uniref:hypothetical protein n=1 Tax=Streptomyces sp. CA-243310 TaxID=3240056 RepID=UPI003D913BA9